VPFILKPAEGEDFINREEIIEDMVKTLSNENSLIGFALYGGRRVGKTSILKEIRRRLRNKKGLVVIYFSMWEIAPRTVHNFVRELSGTILDTYGKRISLRYKAQEMLKSPATMLKKVVRELKITTKLGDDIEFLLTFDEKEEKDYGNLIKKAFNLPEQIAKETNTRCILLIDEFPSIMDLKNGGSRIGEDIIGVIRTIHEDQKHTILCISGSIRKTMETTALSSASPFYRQFLIKEIPPLLKNHVKEILVKNLPGKKITEDAVDRLHEVSNGIPFYVQLFGKKIEIMPQKNIDIEVIEQVITETLDEEANIIFREEFNSLNTGEQEIIISMAKGINSPGAIAKDIDTDTGAVSTYLILLQDKGVITKEGRGFYSINDPVFGLWVRRNYGE